MITPANVTYYGEWIDGHFHGEFVVAFGGKQTAERYVVKYEYDKEISRRLMTSGVDWVEIESVATGKYRICFICMTIAAHKKLTRLRWTQGTQLEMLKAQRAARNLLKQWLLTHRKKQYLWRKLQWISRSSKVDTLASLDCGSRT